MPIEDQSFEQIFDQVCSRLKSRGEVESTSKHFATLTCDYDRYSFVKSLVTEDELKRTNLNAVEKSESKSSSLRESGNDRFRKKRDLEALDLYTQSILLAPADSKVLALGFGNRSAVLKSLGKYEDCISDVNQALKLEFPENLAYKVLIRQGECLKATGKYSQAIKVFQEAKNKLKIAELNEEKSKEQMRLVSNLIAKCSEFTCPKIFNEGASDKKRLPDKTYGQNKEIICASNCIEINFSPDMGRHLSASRDIEPGDVIIVEKPYAWILLPEYLTSHCSFCLSPCASLIPCPDCVTAMYCGEKCLDAALAKYHHLECKSVSSVLKLDMGKMSLLAVRIMAVAGPSFLSKFLTSSGSDTELMSDEQIRTLGFNSDNKYDSLDFAPIFHLICNTESRTVSDLFKRSLMAVFLVKSLNLESHPDASLFGGVLLRLLQNLPCNAHEVSETAKSSFEKVPVSLEIGAAAYACLSLLNHSCDPNVVRHSHGNTAVLRAIKFIPKGGQILDNYGYHFAVHPKPTRQLHLKSQYLFNCNCEACLKNWPLHQSLPSTPSAADLSAMGILENASKQLSQLIQSSLEGGEISEIDLQKIFKHLKVLALHGGRLCQEFNCCQEIVKQYLARQGNFYSN